MKVEKKLISFGIPNVPLLVVCLVHPSREGRMAKAQGVSFPADLSQVLCRNKLNQQTRKCNSGGFGGLPSPSGACSSCDTPCIVPGIKKSCQAE